jgi:hypothetical protein
MSPLAHRIYIFSLVLITVVVFILLASYGANYYLTDIDQRFFHQQNEVLKPSGFIGHGAGMLGSILMLVGVFGYMARKRFRSLSRLGFLKHWLEFHIFLCTLGPVLVLYHTTFKFGGLVAVSFWSMVAVVVSGIVGRFIYLQIPRTIEGREMSLNELNTKKANFYTHLQHQFPLDNNFFSFLNKAFVLEEELYEGSFFSKVVQRGKFEKQLIRSIKSELKKRGFSKRDLKNTVRFIHAEIVLSRRIAWLSTMQNFLRYWHVAHLPFALIMLVIMIVHVAVAILFGYTWI